MIRVQTPWLYRKNFDLAFILFPSFLAVLIALFFGDYFSEQESLSLWTWVILVLGIDVSHVYSTLYKTYFHPVGKLRHKNLLYLVPLVVWVLGVILYTLGAAVFWSVLAYLAVFHFIRQQYGFLRLYGQRDSASQADQRLDSLVIYAGTLYPIIYWHAYPREFNWFIKGDFLLGLPAIIERVALVFYVFILLSYVLNELRHLKHGRPLNVPKNLIVLGTVVSWYVGIVLLNGDFTFTITNIVAHGIPYMALVWIWGRRNKARVLSTRFSLLPFLGIILALAYVEEAFWAGLVWREHLDFFTFFQRLPVVTDKKTLSLLVPLLTLPQATHYILDGFIWKGFSETKNSDA